MGREGVTLDTLVTNMKEIIRSIPDITRHRDDDDEPWVAWAVPMLWDSMRDLISSFGGPELLVQTLLRLARLNPEILCPKHTRSKPTRSDDHPPRSGGQTHLYNYVLGTDHDEKWIMRLGEMRVSPDHMVDEHAEGVKHAQLCGEDLTPVFAGTLKRIGDRFYVLPTSGRWNLLKTILYRSDPSRERGQASLKMFGAAMDLFNILVVYRVFTKSQAQDARYDLCETWLSLEYLKGYIDFMYADRKDLVWCRKDFRQIWGSRNPIK